MFPPMLPPSSYAPVALSCSLSCSLRPLIPPPSSHVPSYAPSALLSPLRPPMLPFLPSLMLPSPSPLRSCLVLAAVSASPRIRLFPFSGFSCPRFSQNTQPASFFKNSLPVSFLSRNCMRCIAPNRPTPYWLIRFSWQDILSIWAQVLRI